MSDPNPALAATAAAALGKLDRGEGKLMAVLDQVGPAWRSLVLWGIAQSDLPTAQLAAEDQIERLLLKTFEP